MCPFCNDPHKLNKKATNLMNKIICLSKLMVMVIIKDPKVPNYKKSVI